MIKIELIIVLTQYNDDFSADSITRSSRLSNSFLYNTSPTSITRNEFFFIKMKKNGKWRKWRNLRWGSIHDYGGDNITGRIVGIVKGV